MKQKYCKNCKQLVRPVKRDWSWIAFFLCLGMFYPIYRIFVPANRCPMCKSKSLIGKRKAKRLNLIEG